MEVKNSLTQQSGQKKLTFSQALETDDYKKLINTTLRDSKRANRFVAAVVAAVSATPALQDCSPSSILSAALQGEALELSPSPTLGEYYLVPYKKTIKNQNGEYVKISQCQFQIGTAGRIQLAMRSGQFKDLGAIEIRQGEYLGRNPENGKPSFKFETDDDVRENLPIIGYLGYFTLTNGFSYSVYFSKEKCLKWAERYSKSFDRKLYDKVQKGEKLDWKEESQATQPWMAHTNEMCKNLVLRQALKIAPKSIEMRTAEEYEEKNENTIAEVFATPTEAQNDFFEASKEQPLIESNEAKGNAENINSVEIVDKKTTKTRKKKEETETAEQADFFQQ